MKKWGILLVLSITVLPSLSQYSYGNSLVSPSAIPLGHDSSNPGTYYVLRPQHLLPSPYTAQQPQLISAVLNSNRAPTQDARSSNSFSGNTPQQSPVSSGRVNAQSPVVPLSQPVNVVKYTLVRSSATVSGGYNTQPKQEISEDQEEVEALEDNLDADEDDVGEQNSWGNEQEEAEDEDESQAEAPLPRPVKPARQRTSPKKERSRNRAPTQRRPGSKRRPAEVAEEVQEEVEDAGVEDLEDEEAPRPKSQGRRRNKNNSKEIVRSNSKERRTKSRPSNEDGVLERTPPKVKSGGSRVRTSSSVRKDSIRNQSVPRKNKQNGRGKTNKQSQRVQAEGPQYTAQDEFSVSPANVDTIVPALANAAFRSQGVNKYGANLQLATISPESQNQVLNNLITTLQRNTAPVGTGYIPSQVPSPIGTSPSGSGFRPAGNSLSGFNPAGNSPSGYNAGGNGPSGFSPAGNNPSGYPNGINQINSPPQVSPVANAYSSPQQVQQQSPIQTNTRQPLQGSNNLNSGNPGGSLSPSPPVQFEPGRDYRVVPALRFEVSNGNYIVPSPDNGQQEQVSTFQSSQSSEQANPNQIRPQYQAQSTVQQNSISSAQYGPVQNQVQQVDPNKPQLNGELNPQGSQTESNNTPSVQYGPPGYISPQDESNNGQYSTPAQNPGAVSQGSPNGNQISTQYGDNGVTDQRPIQSSNEFSNQYGAPPGSPAASMVLSLNQNPSAISSPLFGIENINGYSTPQNPAQESADGAGSGNPPIPQNTLREAINLVALFAKSQVNGQNVISTQSGTTQFSVSPSQVYVPNEQAAKEIFRNPVQNIGNVQQSAGSNGNGPNGQVSEGGQNSQYQAGYNNQQGPQQNNFEDPQSPAQQQQQGYNSPQSSQNGQQQGYSNQQFSSQNGLGNQQPQQSYSNQQAISQNSLENQQSQNSLGNQQSQVQQQGYRIQQRFTAQDALGSQRSQIQQLVYRNHQASLQNGLGSQQSQLPSPQPSQNTYGAPSQQVSSQSAEQFYRNQAQSSSQLSQQAYGAPTPTEVTKVTNLSLAYPKPNSNEQSVGGTAATQTIFKTISNLLTRSSYGST